MLTTPKSERRRVTFIGRTNVGKSSLINALLNQKVSIVSPIAGTTTDPTEKAVEILPAGPLVFTDTAGIDDTTPLAAPRIKRTEEILLKTDLAVFVFAPPFDNLENSYSALEKKYVDKVKALDIPYIFVINKCDLSFDPPEFLNSEANERIKLVSCKDMKNIDELRAYIGHLLAEREDKKILEGLIEPSDIFILVTPVHPAYPKGRIKPLQVQVIREILDNNGIAIETKPENLISLLKTLNKKPKMVITDATTIREVANIVSEEIKLTTFSLLFARYKGDLNFFIKGVNALQSLKNKSKVAVIEGCTHHRLEEDLGRDLIPLFLKELTSKELEFTYISGTNPDFERLKDVSLALHCGGCMITRKDMQTRLKFFEEHNINVINYGMLVALKYGFLERTISPFIDEVTVI